VINTSTHSIADDFVTLPSKSNPYGIVADRTGKLRFTETGTGKVGYYDPTTQTFGEVATASAKSTPKGIALGPDGNLWFVEAGNAFNGAADQIGVNDPKARTLLREVAAPATGSISAGPDGALWFAEANGLGRIDPTTNAITTLATPNLSPGAVANGAAGNLWFAAGTDIGVIDLSAASTPAKLAITVRPPTGATAGKGFGLIVGVENAANGSDTDYSGPVTIALGANPGGSFLSGTVTATALNGVATFPGLSLDQAGAGYTIVATSPGLASATSGALTVSLAATRLMVTAQPPSNIAAGAPFVVTVAAVDASGNVDTSFEGTLTIGPGNKNGGATLSGPLVLGADAGTASFVGLALDKPGTNDTLLLADSASKLQGASTTAFNVTPKPATHLVITGEPPLSVAAGAPLGLVVSAENDLGQGDTGDADLVSLALAGGNLLGGTPVRLVAGVATFSGLSIDRVGSTYAITASAGSLAPATSTTISVANAPAAGLVLTPPPGSRATTGVSFAFTVSAVDAVGNPALDYSGTVHFTSTDANANLTVDATFTPADHGTHSFQVTLSTLGVQSLTATDTANPALSAGASIEAATVGDHDDGHGLAHPGRLRPGDHPDGDRRLARVERPDRDGLVPRRVEGPRLGEARRGRRAGDYLQPRPRAARDHRFLFRRRQLDGGDLGPGLGRRQPGGDRHDPGGLAEPRGARQARHPHRDRARQGPRRGPAGRVR